MAQTTSSTSYNNVVACFNTGVFHCLESVRYWWIACDNVNSYLVRCETSAQYWAHDGWVNVVGEDSEVVCVKGNVFLEAAVFMMQVVCAL